MKILIVKTSALGDIIHAFPTLQYLRHKFPEAQIDWIVEKPFAEIVQAHPDVNKTLLVDTRTWRNEMFAATTWEEIRSFRKSLHQQEYDVVFDLQSNIKSGLLTFQTKAKDKVGFGKETVHESPNLFFTNKRWDPPRARNIREDYLFLAQSYFNDFETPAPQAVLFKLDARQQASLKMVLNLPCMAEKSKVMVCPGSAWRNKQLEKSALIDFLKLIRDQKQCHLVLAWGNSEEKLQAEELHAQFLGQSTILDRLSLPVLQNVMNRMELVIAVDSLPLHLAGTTSVKTFSVFGPSCADKFKPEGKKHQTFQGLCPYGRLFEKRCPVLRTCSTGACIKSITGQALYNAFTTSRLQR